jgi:hypothetical protein
MAAFCTSRSTTPDSVFHAVRPFTSFPQTTFAAVEGVLKAPPCQH